MKARDILAFAVWLALAAALTAQEPGGPKAESAREAKAGTPVFMQPGDLAWADLDPKGAPGIKIVDLWGDHAKGAYGALLKFPAGFLAPLHTHTSTIRIVVLSGTYTQAPEGKPEQRMGPGSYVLQPGGNYRHVSGCDKASECVLFIESGGKFDLKPVAAGRGRT